MGISKRRPNMRRLAALALLVGLLGCSEKPAPRGESPAGSRGGRGAQNLDALASPTITSYRSVWAIVVGIDQYPGGASELKRLEHAVNDAREVRDLLRGEFGYQDENIHFLADQDASRGAIRDAFQTWLPAQRPREDDSVFVFFAGHGLVDDKSQEGYLAAADSRAGDLRGSCVGVSWIRDRLAALPCRHKLLILDSCYSGTLFQDKPRSAMPTLLAGGGKNSRGGESRSGGGSPTRAGSQAIHQLADYFRDQAFYGMSAGRLQPVADGEGENRHSIFTAALLRVMRERANSSYPNHEFTFRQLASQVEMYVASTPGSHQTPDSGALAAGRGDFVFRPTVRRQTPREIGVLAEQMFERTFAVARRTVDAGQRSEREQREQLVAMRGFLDTYLSMCAQANISGDKSYQHVLDWKGAILSRQRRIRETRDDARLAPLHDELHSVTAQLVKTAYARDDRPAHLRELKNLIFQREELERELARASNEAATAHESEAHTVERLAAALPAEAVFIDFLEYDHAPIQDPGESPAEPKRRLAAFVVKLDRSVVEVDLGSVAKLGEIVDDWRNEIEGRPKKSRSDANSTRGLGFEVATAADMARDALWKPLEKHVAGAKLVFISPDGVTCRVPFAALPGAKPNSYLIEEYCVVLQPVSQLICDFAERPLPHDAKPNLLVMGGVDYGAADGDEASPELGIGEGSLLKFPTLPGTHEEILATTRLYQKHLQLGQVITVSGRAATVLSFCRRAPTARLIHISTHGFSGTLDLHLRDQTTLFASAPGIECGLPFAGVNQWSVKAEGTRILTALEVASLDLRQTDIVVLAACDSAGGQIVPGEGTFGLQRAFHLAGVRSVVASLWTLNDAGTRMLMADFYENLWGKKLSKPEALRQAQLTMSCRTLEWNRSEDDKEQKVQRVPPFYWAPFVLSGDWR